MKIERIHDGEPILSPVGTTWQSVCTANSSAVLLERNAWTDGVLAPILGRERLTDHRLADGVVVSLYTGVGVRDGETESRQFKGLAFFTPDLDLVLRLPEPVLLPSDDPAAIDRQGIEDVRLTVEDGIFSAWYCGYDGKDGAACVAQSHDLLHWTKTAPLPGDINRTYNKDHVPFPGVYRGKRWMLHRPWGPEFPDVREMVTRLATSDGLLGPWTDAGGILRGLQQPGRRTWTGAGPAPIALSDGRFLLIYHTGCFFEDGYRQYDAAAALVDLGRYSPQDPGAVVVGRIEPLFVPKTLWEKNADLRIDIVFPTGAFVHGKDLVLVYGAGDRFTCAARLDFAELVAALETSGKSGNGGHGASR